MRRAPVIIPSREHPAAARALWASDVDSIVVPGTACGGQACLSLGLNSQALVIAVEDNKTLMEVGSHSFNRTVHNPLHATQDLLCSFDNVLTEFPLCNKVTPDALNMDHVAVGSYFEAIGVIAAHKVGVNPASMTGQISGVRPLPKQREGSFLGGRYPHRPDN